MRYLYLFIIIAGFCNHNLYAQDTSKLSLTLDSLLNIEYPTQMDSIATDSCIINALEISESIFVKKEVDRFIKDLNLIKIELKIVDDLLKDNDYRSLNNMVKGNDFQYFLNDFYMYQREPIKENDTLYIEYISMDLQRYKHREIALKYLQKLGYSGALELDDELLQDYPEIRKRHILNFYKINQYHFQVESLSQYRNNKEEYSDYLLKLIEELLENYNVIDSDFNAYVFFEQENGVVSINHKIKFRYNFLNYCYGKFKEDNTD